MSKVKKIMVLNPYVATLGGGEKHMGYLCQFMEEYYNYDVDIDIVVFNYNEVDVFAPDFVTIDDVNKQFGLNLRKTKIRKVDLKNPQNIVEVLLHRKKVEDITAEYDLFINFMFMSKHIGKAKVNIYECMFPRPPFVPRAWWKKKVAFTERKHDHDYYHSYDYFISNSEYTKNWAETYWGTAVPNIVIYPPVFSEEEIKDKYQESEKKNIIISCGRFFVASHSKKQLELVRFFVKNYEIFKTYEYHLVGAVFEDKKDLAYLKRIKHLAAQVDNVFIHENCPYEELMDLYKKAKIFWHGTGYGVLEGLEPQKMEHFGITTIEAMSNGAVPVVINKGGQKETVVEGVTGFKWDTEDECIEKTRKLIEDDNLRKEMAEKSAVRANEYSIEKFYERHREIFRMLHI
ncbi:hypothetical protein GCM10008922_34250 [Faecalicatena contorta]|uniref:glycosyltransferase family 4 protein n=1 Tax=Faecalicatena contorta TaxID=39482 RepID=UPI002EB6C52A|nr:glycosyltransferase family 4 protein [Muricomes sp.]